MLHARNPAVQRHVQTCNEELNMMGQPRKVSKGEMPGRLSIINNLTYILVS